MFEESIKSVHTKNVHHGHLTAFLKFSKLYDPDELLKLPREQLQILLEDYVFHIKKRMNPNSVSTSLQGVKHFFAMNDMMINWKKLAKFYPEKIKRTGFRSWTTEEISKMLQCTTKLRNIAIIHFLASTGARVGVFEHNFNLKHIKKMPDGCKSVQLYAGFKEEYTSFLTPEAASALDEYLVKRRKDGEVFSDDSPVFRARYLLGSEKAKSLRHNGFRMVIYRIIEKSRIIRKKIGPRYDVQVDHGFRKRFNTILKIQNDINSNIAEKLMGHSTSIPLDNAYLPWCVHCCFIFHQRRIHKKVWFYDMENDGFSLDDTRKQIEDNDIPDVIERFKNRHKEKDNDRKKKYFFIPIKEIEDNDYDLNISQYREIEYKEVEYEKPEIIKNRILDLENKIIDTLKGVSKI